jgi:hypothetical protein
MAFPAGAIPTRKKTDIRGRGEPFGARSNESENICSFSNCRGVYRRGVAYRKCAGKAC